MNLVAELPAGLTGLEQLQQMLANGRVAPIGETLGFKLAEVEEGRVVFESVPGVHAYNPIGTVHGGYAAMRLRCSIPPAVARRTRVLPRIRVTPRWN